MTLELSRDKLDEVKAAKKLAREAKKAERSNKKAEEKDRKSSLKKEYADYKQSMTDLQTQYEKEAEVRGYDLRTWPIDVLMKYRDVAPYFNFGIELPDEEPIAIQQSFVFDPTQGFKPTIQKEPELIKPFEFVDNIARVEKPKKDPNMTDAEFMALELAFGKYLTNQIYRYELYNGIYKLFITRIGGVEESYIIDNGTVLGGNEFSVLANKVNDTIFVFADDPEMSEILRSKFYTVTDNCVQRNLSRVFESGVIYRFIDFSNTAWLNGADIDKKALEAGLLGVINIISNNGESPRMRFARFESAKSFELVSDSLVKSPLSDINATSNIIIPGLLIKVKDNSIEIYNNQNLAGRYTLSLQ